MQLSDFHFDLPKHLIAKYPLPQRSQSRLMVLKEQSIQHQHFVAMLDLVNEGDLIVFNNTKVIPARLFGKKVTGGKVEILVERILDDQCFTAQVRSSKPTRLGDRLLFDQGVTFRILDKKEQFYTLKYEARDKNIFSIIDALGEIPLPPYMERRPDENDLERYQTVYAADKGSIAAPTAGLHFDEALLAKLRQKNIRLGMLTLHIGAGTFLPVRVEDVTSHRMHAEYVMVSEELCEAIRDTKRKGKRVIAVGTTAMRALEAASATGSIKPYHQDTTIFIYPGYEFQCVDALITNLHLPSSTLLMLVCAFAGYDYVMQAYREAVLQEYRFYSYGDAMWVNKATLNSQALTPTKNSL
ncbi:MAG: tRNA preQ1(34) S-adenosylmethionine ribosyltransferase-isomerase QueA [Gammaproteobacteria bacterium]|nr:tRNA preQ1(34) S-adenosylmethionine ribosyltransferase-isomerase QueA [Gammaproteobacteria bacterium]